MSEPEDYIPIPIFGASDEPIQRQRQTVSTLENIEKMLSEQTKNLKSQNQEIIGLLKRISEIGWIIFLLLAVNVVRHW